MKKVRLGDIATVITKGTTPTTLGYDFVDDGVNFVKIESITENGEFLTEKFAHITDECDRKLSRSQLQRNDLLFSIAGAIGRTAIVTEEILPANTNQALAIIRVPEGVIDYSYLKFVLQSPDIVEQFEKKKQGVAQLNISLKDIGDFVIPLRTAEEQKSIVATMDKVSGLIALRKEQLAKLDQLVKSRFIELFGDPMANPMGWDRVNISAVVGGKVSNGFFAKRDDYCDGGNVKVLGVAHVVNRMYSNTEDLPTTNGTEADVVKYGLKYGDMLFCRSSLVAAGIGKASIVPKDTPNNVLFECHVIRLPLDLNKCVPEFMQVLSTTDYFRNQVIAQAKTATMTTIGQDGILKTDIILPPMEMQKKFLAFVEQTDKAKLAIQQSLNKLELLKKSLMQEYFG